MVNLSRHLHFPRRSQIFCLKVLAACSSDTIKDAPITIRENRYEGLENEEGRRNVTREIKDVPRKAENIIHNGITVLLIRIMLSNTTVSAKKPSLPSRISPRRTNFWT